MKNVLKIVLVVVGTLVGAGFASGKEIYSFFFVYGIYGFIGIFISSIIIGWVIYKVLNICQNKKINSYHEFCGVIASGRISSFLNNIVNIFLLISFFVMIAGFSSFTKQEFSANGFIASSIIVAICYFVFCKNVSGLIKISNYLIPILIFFIIYISMKKITILDFGNFCIMNTNNINLNLIEISAKFNIAIIIESVIKAILYASYNCIILIPVLVTVNKQITNKQCIFKISIASAVVLIVLSFSIFNILLQGNITHFQLEMPVIGIIKQHGAFYQKVYLIIIAISIFTTAISSGCGFLNNCSTNKKQFKRNLAIMSISAVFLSQIPFSMLVNLLYPVLGVVGIFEIIVIFMRKPCKKV